MGSHQSAVVAKVFDKLVEEDFNEDRTTYMMLFANFRIQFSDINNFSIEKFVIFRENNLLTLLSKSFTNIFDASTKSDKGIAYIPCCNSLVFIRRFVGYIILNSNNLEKNADIPTSLNFFKHLSQLFNYLQSDHDSRENERKKTDIKYEIICCILSFLFYPNQDSVGGYSNIYYKYLSELFDPNIFISSLLSTNDEEYKRVLIIFILSGVITSKKWNSEYSNIALDKLSPLFSILLQNPDHKRMDFMSSSKPSLYHEITSLFYITLLTHREKISLFRGEKLIIHLLVPIYYFKDESPNFFFNIMLSSIIMLTSNPKTVQRLSLSSIKNGDQVLKIFNKNGESDLNCIDLLLDVIIMGAKSIKSQSLISSVTVIVYNIMCSLTCFSCYSADILDCLTTYFIENLESHSTDLINVLIDGFNHVLYKKDVNNFGMIKNILRLEKEFIDLYTKQIDTSYIINFCSLFRETAHTMKYKSIEKESAKNIMQSLIKNDTWSDYKPSGPRYCIFSNEMKESFLDWLSTLMYKNIDFKISE